MLVEGRHFLSTVAPERLGHKALAVNLSDLAACGARPLAFTLALALPRVDEAFLDGFARGLCALADAHDIELVGGDTTAGPLNICITVFGEVPPARRCCARARAPATTLWVSGTLGDARLALEVFRGTRRARRRRLRARARAMERPQPRVALGLALRGIATSAIDVCDGLLGDLGHVLRRSGVGADVDVDALPRSAVLAALPRGCSANARWPAATTTNCCSRAAPRARRACAAPRATAGVAVTRIGRIEAGARLAPARRAAARRSTALRPRSITSGPERAPRCLSSAADR